jgi:hypothetical protein
MSDTIEIAEIRKLTEKLFEQLEKRGVTHVRPAHRQYWSIFADEMFSATEPPLSKANLIDDLVDSREELTTGGDVEPALWQAAQHLAGLIQLIAHADLKGGLVMGGEH